MRSRSCWYLKEGAEEPECSRKISLTKDESQERTQPTHDDNTGTRTRATLVGSQSLFVTQAEPREVIVVNAIEYSTEFESPIMQLTTLTLEIAFTLISTEQTNKFNLINYSVSEEYL